MPKNGHGIVLKLTRDELEHLRDIMGALVGVREGEDQVMSQLLAEVNGHVDAEMTLWAKVEVLCEDHGVPVGDDGPDYVLSSSLSVFKLEPGDGAPTEEGPSGSSKED